MSYGVMLILINSVLTNMPMFMLSLFEIPAWGLKELDFYRSWFFWQSDENRAKYRLAKWDILCTPKDKGGLGNENLEVKNKCLLRSGSIGFPLKSRGYGYSYCKTGTYIPRPYLK